MKKFINPNDAKKIIESLEITKKIETIAIKKSLGRVLATPIVAPFDFPPFDKSTMDGYAISSKLGKKSFKILGESKAGGALQDNYKPTGCIHIMTGAYVPKVFDKVVRVEFTHIDKDKMEIVQDEPFSNITKGGAYFKKGDTLLCSCSVITPQVIGLLCSVGLKQIQVFSKPKVGILTLGDELLAQNQTYETGKIYDSNLPMLACQVTNAGGKPTTYPIIKDNKNSIRKSVEKAFKENDIVLLSGGSSMGKYDFVPLVLKNLGVEFLFQKIAVKPGKPTYFGRLHNKYVYALAGNPVSSFVTFELFVKPLIASFLGQKPKEKILEVKPQFDFARKEADRKEYLPVKIVGDKCFHLNYKNSGHLAAICSADGFMIVDIGTYRVCSGRNQKAIVLN